MKNMRQVLARSSSLSDDIIKLCGYDKNKMGIIAMAADCHIHDPQSRKYIFKVFPQMTEVDDLIVMYTRHTDLVEWLLETHKPEALINSSNDYKVQQCFKILLLAGEEWLNRNSAGG